MNDEFKVTVKNTKSKGKPEKPEPQKEVTGHDVMMELYNEYGFLPSVEMIMARLDMLRAEKERDEAQKKLESSELQFESALKKRREEIKHEKGGRA